MNRSFLPFLSLVSLLSAGCAPTPASIAFDGGDAQIVIHAMDNVPLRRAIVLDADGKILDPQPSPTMMSWTVTPASVATLDTHMVKPVGNGQATVEAKIGDAHGKYVLTVDLDDGEPTNTKPPSTSYTNCPAADYGNGVYVFGCDKGNFPSALTDFLKTHAVVVSAVSPLVEYMGGGRTEANSYLVVTRPN